MVDPLKRKVLLQLIQSQSEHNEGRALVKISEFFDGKDDLGSIGCNLSDHPGTEHFRKVLKSIESRDDVDEVWLQIYDVDEGDWPFSENVLIFVNASESEIRQMTESLQPSEFTAMKVEWTPSRASHLAGGKYLNLWWD